MRKSYVIPMVLLAGLAVISPRVWADDTTQLKQEVSALQDRVNQLQSELANQQAGVVPIYDQWQDPFAQMEMMQQQMQHAFANSEVFNPKTDIRQTKDQYIVTMDIPGMDKDKINVQTKEGMLIISGERRSETENNNNANGKYYRQERSFGSFMQAIPLPDDARKDHIGATYHNGVLTVTIGRLSKEEKKAGNERITVQ